MICGVPEYLLYESLLYASRTSSSLGAFLRLKGVTKFLPFLRSDGGRMVTEQQRCFVLAKPEFNVR